MQKKLNKKIRKVAVVLRLVGAAGRDLLTGISTYARDYCHWQISIFNSSEEFTPAVIHRLESEGYDGIITSEPGTAGTTEALERSSIPLAIIGWQGEWLKLRNRNVAYIRNDDEGIGQLTADYFAEHGKFRSHAFITLSSRHYWALLREKGFRSAMRQRGKPVTVFRAPVEAGRPFDESALKRFLEGLPKPSAVMVTLDELAVRVLEICRNHSLEVPHQISVIGVDNDTLLCDFAEPPLSSAAPNHVREGEIAAAELERIMKAVGRGGDTEARTTICREKTLVERESSISPSPAAHLIERALRFISQNSRRDIRVEDVVRHLGVSRRLANLRFQEFGERTIAEHIATVRMEEVARMLRRTKQPIRQIAEECDFSSLQHLANAFKRHFNMTMSDYRQLKPSEARSVVPRSRKRPR